MACANFLVCFLSPCSTCESPLSLLRFKLTEVSILSSILFSSLLFPLVGDDDFSLLVLCDFVGVDDDDGCFSVVVVAFAFSVTTLVAFLMDFAVAAFVGGSSVVFLGDFFFFTWVHPSSSLSGWSLASTWGFSFDGGVLVVVVVIFVVDDVVVGEVTAMVVF